MPSSCRSLCISQSMHLVIGLHLIGVHLIDVCPIGVHLTGVHLTGVRLTGVRLTGMHLLQACILFTSLPCASNTGGENPYIDTQDGWKASDCGRLGRQAAGHPWSALRVVKSCRKDCPTASVLPKLKQQLCIQSGTRAHYLNYLLEVGEAGKRSAGNRIGQSIRWTESWTDR
jgi:hypothetical protein